MTNNLDGAGPPAGSLRAAFVAATAAAGPQTICVATGVVGPIDLTTAGGGELVYDAAVTPGLTVDGNGIAVQAAPGARVIDQETGGVLQLDEITISGGSPTAAGGGISASGDVNLTDVTIDHNTSDDRGGGVTATGDVTVTDSTIADNTAGFDGGGICTFGNVTVTGSTIVGNTTNNSGDGGGICAFGTAHVTNSTIVDNTATGVGGGLDADQGLTLVYSTVVQNTSPTGGNLGFVTLASFGSVIAQAQGGGGNCAGTGTSDGFNFTDDSSCGFTPAETHPGVDPALGPLASNGGPTQTRLPTVGSPLIDAIPRLDCQADGAAGIANDQRGVTRPQGAGCDVGAVEPQQSPTPPPSPLVLEPTFTG